MNYTEAAYKLEITVPLLKWFTKYSPKRDGRKLNMEQNGEFSAEEIEKFNQYLWEEWPNEYVPIGIYLELKKEARGRCGCRQNSCSRLDAAHIKR